MNHPDSSVVVADGRKAQRVVENPQFELDFVRARRGDPETSQLAAGAVRDFAGDHFMRIREALARGSATIYELAARTRLSHVQIARRMPELQAGLMARVKAGETRAGPTGRQCRVWELVP